jgi:hypothetical protein
MEKIEHWMNADEHGFEKQTAIINGWRASAFFKFLAICVDLRPSAVLFPFFG